MQPQVIAPDGSRSCHAFDATLCYVQQIQWNEQTVSVGSSELISLSSLSTGLLLHFTIYSIESAEQKEHIPKRTKPRLRTTMTASVSLENGALLPYQPLTKPALMRDSHLFPGTALGAIIRNARHSPSPLSSPSSSSSSCPAIQHPGPGCPSSRTWGQ